VHGDFSIHDLRSETGLVRGLGLYTASKVTVDDGARISIYDLSAGTGLAEVDTDALAHPYAPAEAKPVHLLESVESEGNTFSSAIMGNEAVTTPTVWCLYGRDGVNTSDWTVAMLEVDDTECAAKSQRMAVPLHVQAPGSGQGQIRSLQHDPMSFALCLLTLSLIAVLYRVCWRRSAAKSVSSEYAPLLTMDEM